MMRMQPSWRTDGCLLRPWAWKQGEPCWTPHPRKLRERVLLQAPKFCGYFLHRNIKNTQCKKKINRIYIYICIYIYLYIYKTPRIRKIQNNCVFAFVIEVIVVSLKMVESSDLKINSISKAIIFHYKTPVSKLKLLVSPFCLPISVGFCWYYFQSTRPWCVIKADSPSPLALSLAFHPPSLLLLSLSLTPLQALTHSLPSLPLLWLLCLPCLIICSN